MYIKLFHFLLNIVKKAGESNFGLQKNFDFQKCNQNAKAEYWALLKKKPLKVADQSVMF